MFDKEQIKNMGRNLIEKVYPSSNEDINIITEHCVVKIILISMFTRLANIFISDQ